MKDVKTTESSLLETGSPTKVEETALNLEKVTNHQQSDEEMSSPNAESQVETDKSEVVHITVETVNEDDHDRVNDKEASIKNASVVEACVKSFKSFFNKLLWCKLFEPSVKMTGQNLSEAMERYSEYLLKNYRSQSEFHAVLKQRLKSLSHTLPGLDKLQPGETGPNFLTVFDLSCKLLHAICTLPVHKDTDILHGEVLSFILMCSNLYRKVFSEENGSRVELPPWLLSLFISSCFVSDFAIQAKSIDCLLQQLTLSSATDVDFAYSSDQRIIASISKHQLNLIASSYNLYLVS